MGRISKDRAAPPRVRSRVSNAPLVGNRQVDVTLGLHGVRLQRVALQVLHGGRHCRAARESSSARRVDPRLRAGVRSGVRAQVIAQAGRPVEAGRCLRRCCGGLAILLPLSSVHRAWISPKSPMRFARTSRRRGIVSSICTSRPEIRAHGSSGSPRTSGSTAPEPGCRSPSRISSAPRAASRARSAKRRARCCRASRRKSARRWCSRRRPRSGVLRQGAAAGPARRAAAASRRVTADPLVRAPRRGGGARHHQGRDGRRSAHAGEELLLHADVLAEICAELQIPFRSNGYRYWKGA